MNGNAYLQINQINIHVLYVECNSIRGITLSRQIIEFCLLYCVHN